MSKDRYSDDHTIEVFGNTKTVNIKENLNVLGDLEVGGTATIEDVVVVGNLNVESGATVSFSDVPSLDASTERYKSYSAGSIIWSNYTTGFTIYNFPYIDNSEGSVWKLRNQEEHYLYCNISDIPNDSTITGFRVVHKTDGGASSIMTAFLCKQEINGNPSEIVITELDLDQSNSSLYLTSESDTVSQVIDYSQEIYYIKFYIVPDGSAGIFLKSIRIRYESDSLGK